jgi:hypothetical protein
MRKGCLLVAIAPFVLLGIVFAVQLAQANRMLTALAAEPAPACSQRYRPLAEIRHADRDRSLIRHMLFQRGYGGHRLSWHLGWWGYALAMRALTGPGERTDLFAKLDCAVRGPNRRALASS